MDQDPAGARSATRDFYEQYWADGRLVDNHFEEWKMGRIEATVGELAPGSVLDVGCGDGRVLSGLGRPNIRRFGVDLSDHAIGLLDGRGIDGLAVDLEKDPLPVRDASFDLVLCLDVLEHLFAPDRLLKEIHRVLRPGGHLLATVPNAFNAFNRLSFLMGRHIDIMDKAHLAGEPFSEHIRFFSEKALKEALARAGLGVRRVEYFFPERLSDTRFRLASHLAKVVRWPRLHERLPSLFALEFFCRAQKDT